MKKRTSYQCPLLMIEYAHLCSFAMISPSEIRRIAALAHLELTEVEVEKFSKELSDILDFFTMLQEVNTDGVEPTAQITGLQNVERPDTVQNSDIAAALLACSPNQIIASQIAVKAVL